MKVKILNGLILINTLSILFLFITYLVPQSFIRIILGLPFLLYFPGYVLTSALFLDKKKIDSIEQFALCCGMSLAIVSLIGFGLNYTPWGIRLEPVLFSITIFIILISSIALIRQSFSVSGIRYFSEFVLKVPGWQGNTFNKALSLILIVCIFASFGILGFTIVFPKNGEKFTEFYLLGINGKAQDYPNEFYLKNGQVDSVGYGEALLDTVNKSGMITVGIINHEKERIGYYLSLSINGEEKPIQYQDISINRIGPITLEQNDKWEQEIGFTPNIIGDHQKVEINLVKGDDKNIAESLHLWINVKAIQ